MSRTVRYLPRPLAARLVALALGPALAAALLPACAPPPPPLGDTRSSPHALAQAVLDALARDDRAAAVSLAVTEREFRDHVWPELPAARPERNLPFSYVWGDLRQKSDASLTRALGAMKGRHVTLVAVSFAGGTTRYPSYTVRRETTLKVRDAEGVESELRLFGSSIEKDGAWKVFSYVVDD